MRFISASDGFSAVMQASVMPVRGRSGPAHPWCFPLCRQGALGVSNASTGAARGGALGVHLNNWALHTPIAPRDLRYWIKGHDTYPDPGGGSGYRNTATFITMINLIGSPAGSILTST